MNFDMRKNLIFISMLLILFLSIAMVSASDISADDSISADSDSVTVDDILDSSSADVSSDTNVEMEDSVFLDVGINGATHDESISEGAVDESISEDTIDESLNDNSKLNKPSSTILKDGEDDRINTNIYGEYPDTGWTTTDYVGYDVYVCDDEGDYISAPIDIYLNNVYYKTERCDDFTYLRIDNLEYGWNNIRFTYNGNSIFKPCQVNIDVYRADNAPEILINSPNVLLGNDAIIHLSLVNDDYEVIYQDFNVTIFYVENNGVLSFQKSVILNGEGSITIPAENLMTGNYYLIEASFLGNALYVPYHTSETFAVISKDPIFEMENSYFYPDEYFECYIDLRNDANEMIDEGIVTVYLNDELYSTLDLAQDDNWIVLNNLPMGVNTLYLYYNGTDFYNPCSTRINITGYEKHSYLEASFTNRRAVIGQSINITVSLHDMDTDELVYEEFEIIICTYPEYLDKYQEFYQSYILNGTGQITFDTSSLSEGYYYVIPKFNGSSIYGPCSSYNDEMEWGYRLTLRNNNPTFIEIGEYNNISTDGSCEIPIRLVDAWRGYYDDEGVYYAYISSYVDVYLNGEFYGTVLTDENEYIIVNVNGLQDSGNEILFLFNQTGIYGRSFDSAIISRYDVQSDIIFEGLESEYTYGDNITFTVILVDASDNGSINDEFIVNVYKWYDEFDGIPESIYQEIVHSNGTINIPSSLFSRSGYFYIVASYEGNESISPKKSVQEIYIIDNRSSTDLYFEVDDVHLGDYLNFTVDLTDSMGEEVNGEVNVYVYTDGYEGEELSYSGVFDANADILIDSSYLGDGYCYIYVVFEGNDIYSPSSCDGDFIVTSKNVTHIEIEAQDNILIGEDQNITVTLTDSNGNLIDADLTVEIYSEYSYYDEFRSPFYNVTVHNGVPFTVNSSYFSSIGYVIVARYDGSDIYQSKTKTKYFYVSDNQGSACIIINAPDINIGEDAIFHFDFFDEYDNLLYMYLTVGIYTDEEYFNGGYPFYSNSIYSEDSLVVDSSEFSVGNYVIFVSCEGYYSEAITNVAEFKVLENQVAYSYAIDDSNFATYFDDNGTIRDDAPFRANDTLLLGDLNNKEIIIDIPLTIKGAEGNKLTNTTISLVAGADGTVISDLDMEYEDYNRYFVIIAVYDGVSGVCIENNTISTVSTKNRASNGAIAVFGAPEGSEDIVIAGNNISMTGEAIALNGIVPYYWNASGKICQGVTGLNITDNIISISNKGAVEAIDMFGCNNIFISNNKIIINSNGTSKHDDAYGIDGGDNNNLTIVNNDIQINSANMGFGIDVIGSSEIIILDNNITVEGTGAIGIGFVNSIDLTVDGNTINITGGDYTTISSDDVLGTGNAAIYNKEGNSNLTIGENTLFENMPIIIDDNNFATYFNEDGTIMNNARILANDIVFLSNLNNKKLLIDIPLTIRCIDGAQLINTTISLVEGAHGTYIFDIIAKMSISQTPILNVSNVSYVTIANCDLFSNASKSYPIYFNGVNCSNILNNRVQTTGYDLLQPSAIVLASSFENNISNNNLITNDSNGIYLTTYMGGVNEYNYIFNNTIHSIRGMADDLFPSNFVYGIQVMGSYNDIINNTVYNVYRGISATSSSNKIIGNEIYNIHGNFYSNGTEDEGGDYAIYASSDSLVKDNVIHSSKLNPNGAAISVGRNSNVTNNTVWNVTGIGAELSADNISFTYNDISTSGYGVHSKGNVSDVLISDNFIDSNEYSSIKLEKQSRTSYPHDFIIQNNHLYGRDSSNIIDIDSACTNILESNNIIIEKEINITHNINDSNFYDYFNNDGTIRDDAPIRANDTLLLGNLNNKTLIIDRRLRIEALENTSLSNSVINIVTGSDGTIVNGLSFDYFVNSDIGSNSVIFVKEANNIGIYNNSIFMSTYVDNIPYYGILVQNGVSSCSNISINNNSILISTSSRYLCGVSVDGIKNWTNKNSHVDISENTISIFGNHTIEAIYVNLADDVNIFYNILVAGSGETISGIKTLNLNLSAIYYNNIIIDGEGDAFGISVINGTDMNVIGNEINITGMRMEGIDLLCNDWVNVSWNNVNFVVGKYDNSSSELISNESNENIYAQNNTMNIIEFTRTSDLRIYMDVSTNSCLVGDIITYTITVFNNGPDGASDVVVTDKIDDFFELVSVDGNYDFISGEWAVGDLANRESRSLTLVVKALASGLITNNPTVNSSFEDPYTGNNNVSKSIRVYALIDDSNFDDYFNENGTIKDEANIRAYDVIFIGELTNKKLVINVPLTIRGASNNELINTTISLVDGADGSDITNLNMHWNNREYRESFIISISDGVSNITINNNNISGNSSYDYSAILIYGSAKGSKNIWILNNHISMSGCSDFDYAINVSGYDSTFAKLNGTTVLRIINNTLNVSNFYVAEPIYVSNSERIEIYRNIIVSSTECGDAYGICIEGNTNVTIDENDIFVLAENNMSYGINSKYNNLVNFGWNNITATGLSAVGIGFYQNHNIGIYHNNVSINGGDGRIISTNDILGIANVAIFNKDESSTDVFISNNAIYENYPIDTYLSYQNMTVKAVIASIDTDVVNYINFTLLDSNNNTLSSKAIRITFNNESNYYVSDENGVVSFEFTISASSNYTIEASFEGDENYLSSSAMANVEVIKQIPSLTVEDQYYYQNDSSKALRALFESEFGNPIKNRVIVFAVDGNTYTIKTDSNGIAEIDVPISTPQTIQFNVSFVGDDTFEAVSKVANLTIYPNARIEIINNTVDNSTGIFKLKLLNSDDEPISHVIMSLEISGEEYLSITDSKGIANFIINDLSIGNYSANISLDGYYSFLNTDLLIEIVYINHTVEVPVSANASIVMAAGDGVVTIVLKDLDGIPIEGVVNVTVNGISSNVHTDSNGEANVAVSGNYSVSAVYTDSNGASVTASLVNSEVTNTVVEYVNVTEEVPVSANATIRLVAGDGVVTIVLKDLAGHVLANKAVNVSVDGDEFVEVFTDEYGQATVEASGNYSVVVVFVDENGASVRASLVNSEVTNTVVEYVNVTEEVPVSANATIDLVAGDGVVTIVLKDLAGHVLANKAVNVSVDGDEFVEVFTDEMGLVTVAVSGNYSVSAVYTDSNGASVRASLVNSEVTNTVVEYVNVTEEVPVSANATIDLVAGDGVVTIVLKDLDGIPIEGVVNVTVNGISSKMLTDSNGEANVAVSGNYSVSAVYTDSNGASVTASLVNSEVTNTVVEYVNVTEEVPVSANATIRLVAGDGVVTIVLKDLAGHVLANKAVNVSVDGDEFVEVFTDEYGQATVEASGNYSVVVVFVDENGASVRASLVNSEVTNTVVEYVNVTEEVPVSANATIDLAVDEGILKITLRDLDGNALANKGITATVNGISSILSTDGSGEASIRLNDNDTVKVVYADLNGASVSASLTNTVIYNTVEKDTNNTAPVNPAPTPTKTATAISASDMTTTAINTAIDGSRGSYYSITLKDKNGKKLASKTVTVKLNGVNYNLKTDGNGVAKFRVHIVNAGTYTASINFAGDSGYASSSANAKIVVKKQTPKLTTAKKTYKLKAKTKKLAATLKTSFGKVLKNKKITFIVKGKKYTAKTNAKGIATVKVKLTKKGTYKFTVKYSGDKTYSAISKKSKVVIK